MSWQSSEWWALPVLIVAGAAVFMCAAWVLCFAVLPALAGVVRECARMLRGR